MDNTTAFTNSLAIYRKAAGSSEPASYDWSLSGAEFVVGGIQSFAGVDPVNPIDVENGQITTYSLSHPTPSVTTTVANAMLVTFHTFTTATTWSPPTGMTEGFDVANTSFPVDGGQSIEGNWVLQTAAGATGTKTATASGTTNMQDWGNAAIVALRPGAAPEPKLHFIHTDHLNTPRLITNDVGQAVWTWNNDDPFGANVPNENPSSLGNFTCNLRLPGQYFDKETNLHYNYFRDFAPDLGRYWQSDPIGMEGGVNTYAYVASNPLLLVDPLGLFDLPSIPQPAVDFLTGVADAASLGLGPLARRALDVGGGVDQCSGAYSAGQFSGLFLGVGRVAYAGAAKALPILAARGASSLEAALAISAARNLLRQAARFGAFPNYRIHTASQVLAKYGNNPTAIIAAATRTNPLANAAGTDLLIGASLGRATCDCQER